MVSTKTSWTCIFPKEKMAVTEGVNLLNDNCYLLSYLCMVELGPPEIRTCTVCYAVG